jgi:alpha-L-arabinofuranosidase
VNGQDRHTTNLEVHDAVTPQTFAAYELADGRLSATLPPLSWSVFEIEAAREQ